ncbi:MAG: DUF420 domain-containing protein [Vicinamibacteraceae bacterium]|nr:DUF420 domain-containing protein [Vicinamibacteraceae bacterium]
MSVSDLPTLNATLNLLATVCLVTGWRFIRQDEVGRHRAAMVGALACSALFLTSYLVYHYYAGSRPFTGTGPIRTVYFFVLITHVVLAAAIVPLVLVTVTRAIRGEFERHRRIARWTLPIWLYVSVTGVIVYVMLYRM